MDFSFSEEQQMLLDSARRFVAERYTFTGRNKIRDSPLGWSHDVWGQLAELGLLAICVPEADGGVGADPVGVMLVCGAVGEGLLLEPFLASAVIATQAIVQLGSEQQREHWLPRMTSGELIAVLAHEEPEGRFDATLLETSAVKTPDGWELNGRKSLVYHATSAELFLVTARIGMELGVFAVTGNASGVKRVPYTSVDDQPVADLILDRVCVSEAARLGSDGLQEVLDLGLAALCAEAFGALERIFSATTDYIHNRVQFGVPIGTFQALRHRMTEMLLQLEQARSMLYLATCRSTASDPQVRRAALSAAKTLIGQAARYVAQQAVQLHGGIGMTDELAVSHYFRRLLAFELRFGTTDQHLENYRRQLVATASYSPKRLVLAEPA